MSRCYEKKAVLKVVLFTVILLLFSISAVKAKEITDIFGRRSTIADRPTRVYSPSPPVTYLFYALDPTMLVGLNFPIREWEKHYLNKRIQSVPVVGGWYGQAQTPNVEAILKIKPEIIITQKFGSAVSVKMNESVMRSLTAPIFQVQLDSLNDYPETMRFLGQLIGREARARELTLYAQKTLSDMAEFTARISDQKKTRVYYAEGLDGLNTDCDNSGHAELINLAGGKNVHHCPAKDVFGMEPISLEQVMVYDPDVILVKEQDFYKRIFHDKRWERIRAVKTKKVFLIPYQPFNWFDRPPSFMRLMGVKWVASCLYPEKFQVDMIKETQDFFRLFLGVNLTIDEVNKLIHP